MLGSDANPVCSRAGWVVGVYFILFSLPFFLQFNMVFVLLHRKGNQVLNYAECLPSAWWFVGGSKQQGLTVERGEIVVELSTEITTSLVFSQIDPLWLF